MESVATAADAAVPELGAVPGKTALVLSGGGARGAYEAGVLRYLFEEFPARFGRRPRFDLICGSSVGAIHACYLASRADSEDHPGRDLAELWRALRVRDVVGLEPRELLAAPWRWLGLGGRRRSAEASATGVELPDRLHGLFRTRALERIVEREVRWPAIGRNLRAGRLEAVCVATTEVATGRIMAFVQTRKLRAPPWTRDPALVARPTRLRPVHALASAAIPVLFPAVRIGTTYYVDGGLRLNTPLAPALRMGADRVLVISLGRGPTVGHDAEREAARVDAYENPFYLYGKVLNALLLDRIESDLAHMRVINALLDCGSQIYGAEFLPAMRRAVRDARGRGFRRVEELVVRPSRDLGELAAECGAGVPASTLPRWLRLLLRSLGIRRFPVEADALSYLYFDASYTAPLVELGFRDAQAREQDFARFFAA